MRSLSQLAIFLQVWRMTHILRGTEVQAPQASCSQRHYHPDSWGPSQKRWIPSPLCPIPIFNWCLPRLRCHYNKEMAAIKKINLGFNGPQTLKVYFETLFWFGAHLYTARNQSQRGAAAHIAIALVRGLVTVGHYSLMIQPQCGTCHLFIQESFQISTWLTKLFEESWKPPNYQLCPLESWHSQKAARFLLWVTSGSRDLNKVRKSLSDISSGISAEPSWEPSTSLRWQQAFTVPWASVAMLGQCLIGELPKIALRNHAIFHILKVTYNTYKFMCIDIHI